MDYNTFVVGFVVISLIISAVIAFVAWTQRKTLNKPALWSFYVACIFGTLAAVGVLVTNRELRNEWGRFLW